MGNEDVEGLTYILPIKASSPPTAELTLYLQQLGAIPGIELIVVDGSSPEMFEAHRRAFGASVRHVAPDSDLATPMGKVGGVLTGVRLASHERMIIADDDIRYDSTGLDSVSAQLLTVDVVRPQNHFDPLPFHALCDSGRILLNRMSGGDWPGTLGVRRSALRRTNGYDGSAMFENLELVRTVEASGGSEIVRPDIYVMRRPSTARHFWSQRVRQAYDEIARPARLAIQLAILPLTVALTVRREGLAIGALIVSIIAIAEAGRRRAGATRFFPFAASLLAPAWVAERAVCSWIAVGSRVFLGGVSYRGRILRHAATPMRVLRKRFEENRLPLTEKAAQGRSA
ncbi:MAG: glycosyltransferase family 2 protein [Gemmatimonadaceae bacterium]